MLSAMAKPLSDKWFRFSTDRHIENDDGRDEANPETTDQTSRNHQTNASRSSLKYTTDGEDDAASDNGRASAEKVSKVASYDGTEEGSSRQNRRNKGLRTRRNDEIL